MSKFNAVNLFNQIRKTRKSKDETMRAMRSIREGHQESVQPDVYAEKNLMSHSITGNRIDEDVRKMASQMAAIPNITALSTSASNERQRKNADKKTRILLGYTSNSRLGQILNPACDRFITYGFLGIYVDWSVESNSPVLRQLDPINTYYFKNNHGDATDIFEIKEALLSELKRQYPDNATGLDSLVKTFVGVKQQENEKISILFHRDKDNHTVYALPKEGVKSDAIVLSNVPNPIGKLLGGIAERPGEGDIPRGHFDDAIYTQIAFDYMARLGLQSTWETVNAPTIVDNTMADSIPMGPGAVIRSADPARVTRLPVNTPEHAWNQQAMLQQQLEKSSGLPQSFGGSVDGSIVTGRGIEQLSVSFNGLVAQYQVVFAGLLQRLLSICLELDEFISGDVTKEISGSASGAPYVISYNPAKDIAGDYTCHVTYGAMGGLDPAQQTVWLLQLNQGGYVSKDLVRSNAPFEIDAVEEERKIKLEALEDASLMAIQGWVQSIPAMAAQGQDPNQILRTAFELTAAVKQGKDILETFVELTTPPEQEATAGSPETPADGSNGGQPGAMGNVIDGVPYGQAGQNPGTRPTLQSLFSGLDTSGDAVGRIGTTQRRAVV